MYHLLDLPVKGMFVARLILGRVRGGIFQVNKSPGSKDNVVLVIVLPTGPH